MVEGFKLKVLRFMVEGFQLKVLRAKLWVPMLRV